MTRIDTGLSRQGFTQSGSAAQAQLFFTQHLHGRGHIACGHAGGGDRDLAQAGLLLRKNQGRAGQQTQAGAHEHRRLGRLMKTTRREFRKTLRHLSSTNNRAHAGHHRPRETRTEISIKTGSSAYESSAISYQFGSCGRQYFFMPKHEAIYAMERRSEGGPRASNGAAKKMVRGSGAYGWGSAVAGTGATKATTAGGPA